MNATCPSVTQSAKIGGNLNAKVDVTTHYEFGAVVRSDAWACSGTLFVI